MQVRLFRWLDRDFVEIAAEGRVGVAADLAITELFQKFDNELRLYGLSLDDCVRVRVWGRDKDSRALATAARSKILTGKRKAASSSFISPQWFDSGAVAAVQLLAMKPLHAGAERRPAEFEPPRNYLCYLRYDSVVFYSGYTSEAGTLNEQVAEVLKTISSAQAVSGALTQDFHKTGRISVFIQRNQSLATVKEILAQESWIDLANVEFCLVDGFAGEKYLIEIEATAFAG